MLATAFFKFFAFIFLCPLRGHSTCHLCSNIPVETKSAPCEKIITQNNIFFYKNIQLNIEKLKKTEINKRIICKIMYSYYKKCKEKVLILF